MSAGGDLDLNVRFSGSDDGATPQFREKLGLADQLIAKLHSLGSSTGDAFQADHAKAYGDAMRGVQTELGGVHSGVLLTSEAMRALGVEGEGAARAVEGVTAATEILGQGTVILAGLGAALAAVAGSVELVKGSLDVAVKSQQDLITIGALLRSQGSANWKAQESQVEAYTKALAQASTFQKGEFLDGIRQMLAYGIPLNDALRSQTAAMGLAVTLGRSLGETENTLAMAYQGRFRQLVALGYVTKQEQADGVLYETILDRITQRTAGPLHDALDAQAGQMANLHSLIEEQKDAIGTALLPVVEAFTNELRRVVAAGEPLTEQWRSWVQSNLPQLERGATAFADAIGKLAGFALPFLQLAIESVTSALAAQAKSWDQTKNPIQGFADGIAAAAKAVRDFEKAGQPIADFLSGTQKAFEAAGSAAHDFATQTQPGGLTAAGTMTPEAIGNMWLAGGGSAAIKDKMVAIAMNESGGNPDAIGPTYYEHGKPYHAEGLWQISTVHGLSGMLEPERNAQAAAGLVRSRQEQGDYLYRDWLDSATKGAYGGWARSSAFGGAAPGAEVTPGVTPGDTAVDTSVRFSPAPFRLPMPTLNTAPSTHLAQGRAGGTSSPEAAVLGYDFDKYNLVVESQKALNLQLKAITDSEKQYSEAVKLAGSSTDEYAAKLDLARKQSADAADASGLLAAQIGRERAEIDGEAEENARSRTALEAATKARDAYKLSLGDEGAKTADQKKKLNELNLEYQTAERRFNDSRGTLKELQTQIAANAHELEVQKDKTKAYAEAIAADFKQITDATDATAQATEDLHGTYQATYDDAIRYWEGVKFAAHAAGKTALEAAADASEAKLDDARWQQQKDLALQGYQNKFATSEYAIAQTANATQMQVLQGERAMWAARLAEVQSGDAKYGAEENDLQKKILDIDQQIAKQRIDDANAFYRRVSDIETLFLDDILKQHKSVRDSLKDVFNEILADWISMIEKMIVKSTLMQTVAPFFQRVFGALGGGSPAASGTVFGGTAGGDAALGAAGGNPASVFSQYGLAGFMGNAAPNVASAVVGGGAQYGMLGFLLGPAGASGASAALQAAKPGAQDFSYFNADNSTIQGAVKAAAPSLLQSALGGALTGYTVGGGNILSAGLGGLGSILGTALGGPVGGSIGGLAGGLLGSLFGPHWGPASNYPDRSDTQNYGQFLANWQGSAGNTVNGQNFTAAPQYYAAAGGTPIWVQMEQWANAQSATTSSLNQAQKDLVDQIKSLEGGNPNADIGVTNLHNGMWTLSSGAQISVQNAESLVQNFQQYANASVNGVSTAAIPLYNFTRTYPDYNVGALNYSGLYTPQQVQLGANASDPGRSDPSQRHPLSGPIVNVDARGAYFGGVDGIQSLTRMISSSMRDGSVGLGNGTRTVAPIFA